MLASVLQRLDPQRRFLVWQKWNEIAGEPLASRAQPRQLADGVLVLSVANHTWAQELHLLRGDLIARLNRALGEDLVRDIQIVNETGEPAAPTRGRTPRRR